MIVQIYANILCLSLCNSFYTVFVYSKWVDCGRICIKNWIYSFITYYCICPCVNHSFKIFLKFLSVQNISCILVHQWQYGHCYMNYIHPLFFCLSSHHAQYHLSFLWHCYRIKSVFAIKHLFPYFTINYSL